MPITLPEYSEKNYERIFYDEHFGIEYQDTTHEEIIALLLKNKKFIKRSSERVTAAVAALEAADMERAYHDRMNEWLTKLLLRTLENNPDDRPFTGKVGNYSITSVRVAKGS